MPMIFFLPRTLTRHILLREESSFYPLFSSSFSKRRVVGKGKSWRFIRLRGGEGENIFLTLLLSSFLGGKRWSVYVELGFRSERRDTCTALCVGAESKRVREEEA